MKSRVENFFIAPGQLLGRVSVQQLWKVLVALAAAIALAFTVVAGYRIVHYLRLSTPAQATVTEWCVRELSSSQFAGEASFEFEVEGQLFYGKTLFIPPVYLNPFSAEEGIKDRKSEIFTAWFQSSNPSVCSLQKEFPLKNLLYALVTLGVVAYFFIVSRNIC